MSLFKTTNINERYKVEFRVEVSNLLIRLLAKNGLIEKQN